jgi:Holliday junction resolvasome RuvABC endonuclease subunit
MSTVKVVGMDPSLNNWGFAHADLDLDTLEFKITGLKLVSTEPDKAARKVIRKNCQDLARARILYGGLQLACTGAAIAFVEVPVGSQSARAMASYGICVGVLASCGIPMIEVTPTEVKLGGFGKKTATKEEMIEWATTRFPAAPWLLHRGAITGKNEHLADAVAAIQAGVNTDEFRRLVSVLRGSRFGVIAAA